MPNLMVNKFNTYYELHGSGKENLVLIHGLKGDHTGWAPILENLSSCHRVLIFDNRGVGQADSPDGDYSMEQMADDTIALIRHLRIDNPIIAGHSMGGAVAQVMARKYENEIKAIALCNAFAKLDDRSCRIFNDAIQLHKNGEIPSAIFKSFIYEVFSGKFLSSSGMVDSILKVVDDAPYPQTYSGYKGQMAAINQFDSRGWLHEIKLPTLVLHAEEDNIVTQDNARELAKKISHSKFELIAGGHASQIEQPELVFKKINQFIKSL